MYAYDRNGNRTRKEHFQAGGVDWAETYCYNERNQLTERRNREGVSQYLYDPEGNLLKEKNGEKESVCRYDLLNRQTYLRTMEGREQENRYDGEGLRAGQQGSTAYLTGEDGNVENSYLYDAFGNRLESREGIQNRIKYTGQQYDPETGQYYLRARYYNPLIGRFTQEDTYRGDGLNLYAYCGNNPVVYFDPSGFDEIFIRFMSQEEAYSSASGLQPKMQNGKPSRGAKWISGVNNTRDASSLGKTGTHDYTMIIKTKSGTTDWLNVNSIDYETMVGGESKNTNSILVK